MGFQVLKHTFYHPFFNLKITSKPCGQTGRERVLLHPVLTEGADKTPALRYFGITPNSEMEIAANSGKPMLAVRPKAVLKHTQSKR
jgi:hypothetical protein